MQRQINNTILNIIWQRIQDLKTELYAQPDIFC